MKKVRIAVLVAAATACSVSAQANRAAGDACAANLNADGKAIYAAAMAAKPTTETLRATIEKEARSLVMGGTVGRSHARDNAEAAGECAKAALH